MGLPTVDAYVFEWSFYICYYVGCQLVGESVEVGCEGMRGIYFSELMQFQ